MERRHIFNAGPSALPFEVLDKAQSELISYQQAGMSVMEFSHRSKEYKSIHTEAQNLLRELLEIPDEYEVLFLQGGASLQFSMVPMNFLGNKQVGNYVVTGSWSEKAYKEAQKIGAASIAASTKESNFDHIPDLSELRYSDNDAYLHLTSNNTIHGTQWRNFPANQNQTLIADMSSDILSRVIPVQNFSLIYAGAQKNLGPAGVTVVILKNDILERIPEGLPTMLDYKTHVQKKSLYNTPPAFAIYMLSLVLKWTKENGGIENFEAENKKKSTMLYETIDNSNGFYNGHAKKDSRSRMNVTFTLPTEELTQLFLEEATEEGFVGLKGHRSLGGCRASIYNAVPLDSVEALCEFMSQFHQKHNL
ncbi:phosphoserine transaminase [Pseudalkalibacillus caeni]|uniref:Phosphoserine aminotransferase n=1 Tax=Exobacillus caeni TaxID=2574798 RepID=A0A5R9F6D7_9BACL|nr:phosphoserine transaminase [Pseudalkalibacillus caeni]TLS38059.1 phosphoserine transaminase [Pseudalkalibacillus caeni]